MLKPKRKKRIKRKKSVSSKLKRVIIGWRGPSKKRIELIAEKVLMAARRETNREKIKELLEENQQLMKRKNDLSAALKIELNKVLIEFLKSNSLNALDPSKTRESLKRRLYTALLGISAQFALDSIGVFDSTTRRKLLKEIFIIGRNVGEDEDIFKKRARQLAFQNIRNLIGSTKTLVLELQIQRFLGKTTRESLALLENLF
jgi:hypothetical protein